MTEFFHRLILLGRWSRTAEWFAYGLAFGSLFLLMTWRMRRKYFQWLHLGERRIESLTSFASPDLRRLPTIVQAYLQKVLPQPMPRVHHVRFWQTGSMALREGTAEKAFSAEQWVAIDRPAFSWSADVVLAPGIHARVCDRLLDQEGVLQARLGGVIPLAFESGPELLKGELLRYLAELPWTPWGFLYLRDATWNEVETRLWKLSLNYAGTVVHILYQFNEDNLITSIHVDDRPRSMGHGRSVLCRWQGVFADYTDHGGVILPRKAEVSWLPHEGGKAFTYFRSQIDRYECVV